MGGRKTQTSQPLGITALDPSPAQGLNCDGGDCGFAPDAPIRVKFDRWLLPTTAVRQSISLYTEGTQLGVFLMPDYDVTARVLGYRADTPLSPGTVYILQFSDADKDPNGFGFRSYDGDSLGQSQQFAFRTASALASSPSTSNAIAHAVSCRDVLTAMASAGCTNSGCHSGNQPRMGLALDTSIGLNTTAIDQVAHETESGTELTQQAVSGGRFGVQMPVIDAGRPENSYLMYKLLISRWLNRDIDAHADPDDPFATGALSQSEVEEARAWFIDFGAMPPDDVGYPDGVSPSDFVNILGTWIRAGAACP